MKEVAKMTMRCVSKCCYPDVIPITEEHVMSL
jgi:hypothetical protein